MNFKKNIANTIWIFIFILIIGLVYYRWFTSSPIVGGDWPYFFNETVKEFTLSVPSWNTWYGNGLGGTSPIYFLQIYQNFTIFLSNFFNIPWIVIYKISWFGLFIFSSIFSSIYLLKMIFPGSSLWMRLIAPLIFVTNTYVLMVADGGQMGVLLSYSLSPLVLASFIKLIKVTGSKAKKLESGLITGLILSAQVMFDPRIAYLTLIGVFIYFVVDFWFGNKGLRGILSSVIYTFVIPAVSTIFIHAVWILPNILIKQNFASSFGEAYSGIGIVKFLSFANFSQTLSLLHPNWPENIFGKSYFMKPEFLIIPIVTFSSLFFVSKLKESRKDILYFCILGLLGVFLAKGANPPFGEAYLGAFSNIPGFVLFRDSTKFYTLAILAYSILIPFALEKISNRFSNIKFLVPVFFVFFWIFTINPAILGQLRGTFKSHEVPKEYLSLKDFINNQHNFFRTLWIPRQQRFTFLSNFHPSVEATPLLKASSSAEIINKLSQKDVQKYLEKFAIKYVIVPYDPLGEIFQKDRKYDEASYKNLVNELSRIGWLKKIDGFGKIAVFQVPQYNNHISVLDGKVISSKMITPYNYQITVSTNKPTELIFAENYSPYWQLRNGENSYSKKTLENLNSFQLNKTGNYSFEIYFAQENYYSFGRIISLFTLSIILLFLLIYRRRVLLRN